jgi:hypothetical protein
MFTRRGGHRGPDFPAAGGRDESGVGYSLLPTAYSLLPTALVRAASVGGAMPGSVSRNRRRIERATASGPALWRRSAPLRSATATRRGTPGTLQLLYAFRAGAKW